LSQAQQIISSRVNGLGVSGSEVIIDGDNLVITVPGTNGNEARNLGQTARLYIRPVINALPAEPAGTPPRLPTPPRRGRLPLGRHPGGPVPGVAPGGPAPGVAPGGPAPGGPATGGQAPAAQPRPYPQDPPPTPAPAPPPAPVQPGPADPRKDLAERIAKEREWRQSTNKGVQFLALQFEATRCNQDDILAGNDDPNLPLITCDKDHKQAYLLAPSIISGDQIENASSGLDQRSGGYIVDLQFKSGAANTWADYTAAHIGTQTAFTLDSTVVSAPQIREAIPGGRTQITGGDPPFTSSTARELANVLKYGSLPLSFEASEAQTVSATLGLTSLRAGLIAGSIGLLLVLVYSLLYYRALGLLTALSLVASGAMVFAILVLLGRYINYTLDLAGIAGLIIGLGTTADSFVVFFERIKDEIREGRSFRSAVPRGWARARKTVLSGNAVTFLAAAVLYFLAIGQVKGFAFTLGLSVVLDTVVLFLVTWPLVYLASKSLTLAKPAYNGLGAVQQVARERRALASRASSASTSPSAGRG
jgi:preprotein translocase subunit SecD